MKRWFDLKIEFAKKFAKKEELTGDKWGETVCPQPIKRKIKV